MVEQLWSDTRSAVRALAKQPVLVIAATVSIGIAVGVNVAMYAFIYSIAFEVPIRAAGDPDTLHRIGDEFSFPNYRDLRDRAVFAELAAWQTEQVIWNSSGALRMLSAGVVSDNFFTVVGVRALFGPGITTTRQSSGSDRVVLDYEFWQRQFGGDTGIIGRVMTLNGWPYEIAGVMAKSFHTGVGPMAAPSLYVAISPRVASALEDRASEQFLLYGRRRPGTTRQQASAALRAAVQDLHQQYPNENRHIVEQLTDTLASHNAGHPTAITVAIVAALYGLVVLVLLVACANVAGFLSARAAARRRDIALMMMLGAPRLRIARQLLIESAVLGVLGCMTGATLWWAVMRVIPATPLMANATITFVPLRVPLVYTAGLAMLVTIAIGVTPALLANGVQPLAALRQTDSGFRARRWSPGSLLVVGQVAICFLVLVGALIVLDNLLISRAMDPGFDVAHTIAIQVTAPTTPTNDATTASQSLPEIKTAVEGMTGVRSASVSRGLPLGFFANRPSRAFPDGGRPALAVDFFDVGSRFFETMGIRIEQGRDFSDDDLRTSGREEVVLSVVINRTLSERSFAGTSPIGQRLLIEDDPGSGVRRTARIVGVASDIKTSRLTEDPHPVVYRPFNKGVLLVRLGATPARRIMQNVQQTVEARAPGAIVRVFPLSERVDDALRPLRAVTWLLLLVGGIIAFVAMIGLYGVIAYRAHCRTFEVGVRMALGADRRAIMQLVFADVLYVVGAGCVVGTVGSILVLTIARRVAGQGLIGFSEMPVVALVLMGVAVATSLRVAWRAATVDPVVALRHN